MDEQDFEAFCKTIVEGLNKWVYPEVESTLQSDPSMRGTLCPAFPFPRALRIGVLKNHTVVEHVGPEDLASDTIPVQLLWNPEQSIEDFLGLDLAHLQCVRLPMPGPMENIQVFLGDAMAVLGDYLYDIVSNPNDLMLNGVPTLETASDPTFLSNVHFVWSDADGALRTRRLDFVEVFPHKGGGWTYHTEKSLKHFAEFIKSYRVPAYRPQLHAILNEFIQLVAAPQATEPQITAFLGTHPEILQLAFGANALNPQTSLVWQYATGKPNLQPDFMPVRMDGFADILEFKLPRLKGAPVVGLTTRARPSAEVDAALAQIDEYADWCSQQVNRDWLETSKGIKVLAPHTYLVIGHADDFEPADRQKFRTRRNCTIFTYDEFIQMARMQLYRVR